MKRLDASRLSHPRLCVQTLEPAYGDNYKAGYIGFTTRALEQASTGIAYFTKWAHLGDIPVSGTLVVTGENECVQAVGAKSVAVSDLREYFEDPKTLVFFRKPRKCAQALGHRIAETALAQVGMKYDNLLLAARLLEDSFFRRWIHSHFQDAASRFPGRLLSREGRWVSAEFAAYCLDCQPEFSGRGVLGKPGHAIDPQELFEDDDLFAHWSQEPEEGPKTGGVNLVG